MAKYKEILDAINDLKEGFGRIDERTANIYHLTEKQEDHLSKLNDTMLKHAIQISSNKTSIRWLIRILVACGILGGGITGVINWPG